MRAHSRSGRRSTPPMPRAPRALAAFVCVVELRAHEGTQDSLSPVRGQDTDDGGPGGGQVPTWHRQIERERSRATDDGVVRPGPVHALERQQSREALYALLAGDRAEILADRVVGGRELGEVRNSANVQPGQ